MGKNSQVVRLDFTTENDRSGFLTKLADQWKTVRLDPGLQSGNFQFLVKVGAAIVEFLEQDNTFFLQLQTRLGGITVVDNGKWNVVDGSGNFEVL